VSTILSDGEVCTRRVHQCCWCSEDIIAGAQAHRQTSVDAGEFSCIYMHLECAAAFLEVYRQDRWYAETCEQGDFLRGKTWKRGDEPAEAGGGGGEAMTEREKGSKSPIDSETENECRREYLRGYRDGIRAFAWWRDGVEYVGTCGWTLEDALMALEAGQLP